MIITPAVLAHNATDAQEKLCEVGLRTVANRFHLDVLDGSLFGASSFHEPSVISRWTNLPELELHLMVRDPVYHAVRWIKETNQVKRVIIHEEIRAQQPKIIPQLRAMQLDVTLALNPETSLGHIKINQAAFDELLIMGVNPGASGQKFLGETILAKIRRAAALYPALKIVVDGGVTIDNIKLISEAGACRCIAASALWTQASPKDALEELMSRAIINE